MIFDARNSSRRCTRCTREANFVRKSASSQAESPPPTTYTSRSRKKAASHVAHAETPRPLSRFSESRPSQRALAPVATITARDVVGKELGAEALGLAAEVGHHLGPHHAVRVAGVVLDVARDHQLAAPREALDHERLEVCARGVQRGRVARRAAADDDQLAHW